jgi:UDP-N-acetylglucosamine 1-carboxyvinyltransferase
MMSAAAITGSDIKLNSITPSHLFPIIPVFDEMGCGIFVDKNSLRISAPKRCRRVRNIETQPYPGFPTDAQAPVMAALSKARGTSIIKETIFESRFKHISELLIFGADISVNDRIAVINGVKELHGANVTCTDLRGGAAVVVEALSAEGKSTISDIHHIDRGYESIENQLTLLGADAKRIYNEEEGQQKTE